LWQAINVDPAPPNGSKNQIARPAAVGERLFNQRHGLHGRMQIVDFWFGNKPHISLVPRAAPKAFRSLTPTIQNRFVLSLVIGSAQREVVLRPDQKGRKMAARFRERLV